MMTTTKCSVCKRHELIDGFYCPACDGHRSDCTLKAKGFVRHTGYCQYEGSRPNKKK